MMDSPQRDAEGTELLFESRGYYHLTGICTEAISGNNIIGGIAGLIHWYNGCRRKPKAPIQTWAGHSVQAKHLPGN